MKVGIVGTGRMGKAMGGYLADCGFEIVGVWGRRVQDAEKASSFVGAALYSDFAQLVIDSDVLAFAVSDDALEAVAARTAELEIPLQGKAFFHLSGSRSIDVFASLKERDALLFGVHPLQTVSDEVQGRQSLRTAHFFLEAETRDRLAVEEIMGLCPNVTAWIEPGKKSLYHLGACLASNYVTVMYHLAQQALMDSGIDIHEAHQALLPLMEATYKNYSEKGGIASLTGPVSRGDAGTVEGHLQALTTSHWSRRKNLIIDLIKEALAMAKASGTRPMSSYAALDALMTGGRQNESET